MRRGAAVILAVAAVLGCASPALACAVCFGDPESPLTKGALMGVYVLVGVVGFVLAGIAATGVFWIQRSRRLARPSAANSTNTLECLCEKIAPTLSVAANDTRVHWDTTDPR